jgi:putative toxin-antitoxin system antitoxin component (TIGR02293 family)
MSGTRYEEANEVETIIERAVAVIGDKERALRWLGTPVRSLGYATPISLLHSSDGRGQVESVLGRIEHGIW